MILRIERAAAGGFGVATDGGIVHFVRGALPGETAECRVTEARKRHRFADVLRILEPSPHRVSPPCPYYGECGGCQLQHAAYPYQLALKTGILRDALRRIGRVDVPEIEAVPSEPFGYRVRGTFRLDEDGPAFLRAGSHDRIHVERCPLMSEGVNRALPALRALPPRPGVDEARVLSDGRSTLVRFRDRRIDPASVAALAAHGVAGARFADGAWGAERISFPIGALRYSVGSGSFLQANRGANEALVGRLADACRPFAGGGRILDLYAGAGNFALPLADAGCEVVAVEGNRDSFRDLVANVAENGLGRRCRAVRSPVERFRSEGGFAMTLLDPPRTGLSPAARALVLRIGSPGIAYVSCDPATLARDLAALSSRYEVESVALFDFFPQTGHIESFVRLRAR